MLVVKVELWPGGDEQRSRQIAKLVAGNVSNLAEISDYEVHTDEAESDVTGSPRLRFWFKLNGHPRRQSVFALIAAAASRAAELSVRTPTPGKD